MLTKVTGSETMPNLVYGKEFLINNQTVRGRTYSQSKTVVSIKPEIDFNLFNMYVFCPICRK